MLKQFPFFLLIMSLFFTVSWAREAHTKENVIYFVSLADIHFDPFIACHVAKKMPCPLIQELRQAPAEQWPSLFSKDDTSTPEYRQDTNYSLLNSAVTASKKIAVAKQARFVLVLGDFLGHNFRDRYEQYSQDNTFAGYQAFTKKTLAFLTIELAQAFPSIDVYIAVGNNDSYRSDYSSDPNGKFFKDMASLGSSLIKDKNNRINMQREFPTAGYYAVDVAKGSHLRLIVLNTVLFSNSAKGSRVEQAANQELTWLHKELQSAKEKHDNVLIAMHIPAGIDIYASLQFRLFRLVGFWKAAYTKQFESELKQFSSEIVGLFAGHLHADWFQILTIDNAYKIPVTGTPAISPIFGNNSGFKIYSYSPRSRQLHDYATYYYPMADKGSWSLEYDFNQVYQSDCRDCPIINGMSLLQQTGVRAERYKLFYAVSTQSQPIVTKWSPYYWCAIQSSLSVEGYKQCVVQ